MYVRVTHKRIGFLLMLAVLVTVGGVAYASIPSSDGTIRACYQKENGQLRIVGKASDCRNSELAISWNEKGIQGVAGAAGAQGPMQFTPRHMGGVRPGRGCARPAPR